MSEHEFQISEEEFQEFQSLVQRVEAADTEDFLELAKLLGRDPKRDFAGADLSRTNLCRANLERANLREADLSEADLSEADLSLADLHGANLSGVNLSRAILSLANLSGAILSRANLSWAILSWAILSGVILNGAIVEYTQFGKGSELSESEKLDLERRGAIFDDSLGDRESAFSSITR